MGASYPVRYSYDDAGRLVKMETYAGMNGNNTKDPAALGGADSNPEIWPAGDATQWVYYPGTMALHKKLDALQKGAIYSYDVRGPLLTREWARIVTGSNPPVKVKTTYAPNPAGELKGMSYNDGTSPVTLARDGSGRIASISDGTGREPMTTTPPDGSWRKRRAG